MNTKLAYNKFYNKNKLALCFVLIVLLLPFKQKIQSQQQVLSIDNFILPNSYLNSYITILEDKNGEFTVDYVKSLSNFKPFDDSVLNQKSVYWAKLEIKSDFRELNELIIQIGSKRSSDFAEIYVFNSNDSLIKQAKSGNFEIIEQREIRHETGSKFLLKLEPGKEYSLYFRIKNISGFHPNFDIHIYNKEYFNAKLSGRNLVQGILQGALWIMFLYNLFIFFYSRDKVYLYYSLYIIGMALNFVIERGLFIEYSISNIPHANPYFFVIATGLATICYFQFVRHFLNTKIEMPLWDKAHRWMIGINFIITIILLAILFINYYIPTVINISNYLNLIGLLYGFVFVYFLVRQKHKLSRFFAAGVLALAIGTFISLYFLITKSPLSFDPKYFMNGGTIAELLIFSLGLGYRINLVEKSKQKVQIELIEQLKKNDRLKEKVTRELEQRVKERTAEIEQQKEEILAQSENLKSANDILINQKREIEIKNEEITLQQKSLEKIHTKTTDSINYASRIQNVILPSENILAEYFHSHFIHYKPKEIVSGDFYWYRYIERNNKRLFVLSASDATGHGVPGSLVSMLGISLLNETVIRNEVNAASQVLEVLREEVKATFSHSDERLLTRDGIDMAFCIIDLDTLEMQFSGANRPLVIYKNDPKKGTNEEFKGLMEFKPTKNPVGMHHKEQSFVNHTLQLEKGDAIYLFSDGFVDQIGGKEGRKFYYRRFKELLTGINTKPMNEQKQIIVDTYNNWINYNSEKNGTFRQVDDILVMGIRV